jgi:hypothetical protein
MNIAETAASELNHHIAGVALIVIALLALAGMVPRLRFARYVWPALFIGLGLFLAAWSDAEIWPRGDLSWTWLIHHDSEALQHKTYALLLLGLGIAELIRARADRPAGWQRWTFPALALCGAALLTMHAHGGTSGLAPAPSSTVAMAAEVTQPMEHSHHHSSGGAMNAQSAPVPEHASMAMDHADHADHVMDASMLRVKREHLWMTIVGVALALFKFLSDQPRSRRFMHFAWPSAMVCLGVLLVLYRE